MDGVDPKAACYAISQITDGGIFESFALDFLSKYLGYQFVPVAGIKDKGIDGFEHTVSKSDNPKTIYQLSIQKTYKDKIVDSVEKLRRNKIRFDQFIYVTNQNVSNLDSLKDELIEKYKRAINIFDLNWFAVHVNDTPNTVSSYRIFVDSYLHQFNRPGTSFEIANLVDDPRLYTYLRQQVDELHNVLKLDKILIDSLILYSLGETDPDKKILMNQEQIISRVKELVKFDPRQISALVTKRLQILSKKPRRIHYYPNENGYCLLYEERLRIQNKNLSDAALYDQYISDTQILIDKIASPELASKVDFISLTNAILNSLYYKQGVEFSDFVLHGSGSEALQNSLPEIISQAVDNQGIATKLLEIKQVLLAIIRAIVYDATVNQKTFLKKLSLTYTMLFLLQCDPKLVTYFSALASKLNIYVCTSIIIPALSERFLEPHNRRYTNLLLSAQKAGVKLYVNEPILRELVAHFKMIKQVYNEDYQGNDAVYCKPSAMYTIPHIMIRAFYHAFNEGKVNNFDRYISTFTSPRMDRLNEDLLSWLHTEFGIEYQPNSSLAIRIQRAELDRIAYKLSEYKSGTDAAKKHVSRNDAEVILTIFALRERNNELGTANIYGYRTWWLTSDITTQKAATEVEAEKYAVSCYMRPDFLYNYISLAPAKGQVDTAFSNMFPTLLGVNISTYLPSGMSEIVHKYVREHSDESEARKISRISELIDDLKQDPRKQTEQFVRSRVQKWVKQSKTRKH
ncbi:MAG: hypothetical protein A2Z28_06725 [Chloroflexi bacterium RBG_16_51_9]|nr:MAG: hypothetical protein A2Z28_06725 [Chloroflexi bacterium RBG_16_51_9]